MRHLRHAAAVCCVLAVAACGPSYSPDSYASSAAQKAAKVDQGVVVGVRQVGITADGTTGAVAGGAAGGILGSQVPGSSLGTAFGALGGSLIGGIAGSGAERAVGDTTAFEYIVRKPNGDLLSVTQKDKTPLALGQHVLLIDGSQARIVPDYTVALDPPARPVVPMPHTLPSIPPPDQAVITPVTAAPTTPTPTSPSTPPPAPAPDTDAPAPASK